MGYKNAVAKAASGYNSGLENYIAGNSLDASSGTFISLTGGYAVATGAGVSIAGVSVTEKVFDADNQTVDMAKVSIVPTDADVVYEISISGGTITQADVGKYYDLTAAQLVDGATESTTTGQLQMVAFISATLGQFKIVNL